MGLHWARKARLCWIHSSCCAKIHCKLNLPTLQPNRWWRFRIVTITDMLAALIMWLIAWILFKKLYLCIKAIAAQPALLETGGLMCTADGWSLVQVPWLFSYGRIAWKRDTEANSELGLAQRLYNCLILSPCTWPTHLGESGPMALL